jgi:predicted ester cyclase
MSAEENKAIIRRVFEEGHNTGDFSVWDEHFAPDYTFYMQGLPEGSTLEDIKENHRNQWWAGFPDQKYTLDEVIAAEGDWVVVRWTWTGTHTGKMNLAGWGEFHNIPPTGKRITYGSIDMYRFAGRKIVEGWSGSAGYTSFLLQLGVMPPIPEDEE